MQQTHYRTRDNNAPVALRQKVWLYPANEKHGGSIREGVVTRMEPPWYFYLDDKRLFRLGSHCHVYSTHEAALAQRAQDKAEPVWMRHGRFHVRAVATLIPYLAHRTGIPARNITAHKTETGWLHVSWADAQGLHKEKIRIGHFYTLVEDQLAGLISQMTQGGA